MRRAGRRADSEHPLGHGRELYFWSFIVALLVFALGAGVSMWQGINHVLDPQPITDAIVNYVVLGLAFIFEGGSWLVALRQFTAAKGPLGFYEAFRKSKDPTSFIVLFEDSAALLGILIAALGTLAATTFEASEWDGVASILIGVVLAGTAALLARESKSLLIGERADRALSELLLRIAGRHPAVVQVNGVVTVQLAPDQIVAALSLEFADELRAPEIETTVIEIERDIRAARPDVITLFVKPQTRKTYEDVVRRQTARDTAHPGDLPP
jgi:cation diffusion facilitator family transporter